MKHSEEVIRDYWERFGPRCWKELNNNGVMYIHLEVPYGEYHMSTHVSREPKLDFDVLKYEEKQIDSFFGNGPHHYIECEGVIVDEWTP